VISKIVKIKYVLTYLLDDRKKMKRKAVIELLFQKRKK
jgi:hypothetical protein